MFTLPGFVITHNWVFLMNIYSKYAPKTILCMVEAILKIQIMENFAHKTLVYKVELSTILVGTIHND